MLIILQRIFESFLSVCIFIYVCSNCHAIEFAWNSRLFAFCLQHFAAEILFNIWLYINNFMWSIGLCLFYWTWFIYRMIRFRMGFVGASGTNVTETWMGIKCKLMVYWCKAIRSIFEMLCPSCMAHLSIFPIYFRNLKSRLERYEIRVGNCEPNICSMTCHICMNKLYVRIAFIDSMSCHCFVIVFFFFHYFDGVSRNSFANISMNELSKYKASGLKCITSRVWRKYVTNPAYLS